jgi:transcriptional regulator with XRE-family HTH domain
MFLRLGQIVRQKREEAGLTLQQCALLADLPVIRLLELEQGSSEAVSFDLCDRIGRAIAAVTGQRFIRQDLWLAYSVDNYLQTSKAAR